MNMGNPKRVSRFICCKHLGENYIGSGIQRYGHQREKFHCNPFNLSYMWSTYKNCERE